MKKKPLGKYLSWPTIEEWRQQRGKWTKIESAVGAKDGTCHKIYRPIVEQQGEFYSGHRGFNAIHTTSCCRCSWTYKVHRELVSWAPERRAPIYVNAPNRDRPSIPADSFLLADKIHPNRHPILTPYTSQQIARKTHRLRQKCL